MEEGKEIVNQLCWNDYYSFFSLGECMDGWHKESSP